MLLGATAAMPLVWAMGPISGTDNLMHVQQINGGSVVTLENGALFRPYRLDTATESWQCNAASDGAIYANTSLHTIRHCDGTSWVSLGTGAGTVTGTGTANKLAKFTSASAIGDATPLSSTNTVPADGSTFFLGVAGTLPAVTTSSVNAVEFDITSAGSSSNIQRATFITLLAGYTGSSATAGLEVFSTVAGTGTAWGTARTANRGLMAGVVNSTAGTDIGVLGNCQNSGSGECIGIFGDTHSTTGSGHDTGVVGLGQATSTGTGGYFAFAEAGNPTIPHAALVANNASVAGPILIAQDNGTAMFTVDDGGNLRLFRTMTAAGTTGAQTIDKPAGSVNIAAGQSTLVVTNSLAIATSGILLTAMTADTVCTSFRAVRGAGSFTITTNGACNAETAVYFEVRN